MIKSKTAIAIDTFFVTIIIFFVFYIWTYKITKNAFLSLFICNFISILAYIAIFKAEIKKYNISNLKQRDLNFAKECLHFFQYSSPKTTSDFIEKLLSCKQTSSHIFESNARVFYINFKESLSSKDFFFAHDYNLSASTTKKLVFISNGVSDSFLTAHQNSKTNFDVYDFTDFYKVMKQKQLFPISNSNQSKQTFKFLKTKFSKGLTKNNFKNFFFSGLSLISISFFIPFSSHYLIFGTILLILSIICLFKKSTFKQTPKQSLEDQIKK